MLLELTLFFAICSGAATLVAVVGGAPSARWWLSLPLAAGVLAVAAWSTATITGDAAGAQVLAVVALVAMLAMRSLQPWGMVSALLFTSFTFAAIGYLAYAADWTVTASYGIAVWAGSALLLLLEIGALALSISYAFEILDVLGRRRPRHHDAPAPQRHPWVALQVPTYNEPVEVVRPTLESLARLEYPNLLVQVIDNNTTDPALWRPIEQLCAELGPRFSFLHLEPWPGFKAGACNEGTRRLPPEIEIIGIVDADYEVRPGWLQAVIGHFDDPGVGFVQTSQHYREWEDDRYLRGLFYSYRYFFDVTMPARDHRNAIIFCGTMGLIRREALQRIGGWNEACITEDAEASLRMLGHGWRGVYDRRAWGEGLMPLDFDGLKKQRYRWALGGIQILRFHWRELLPFARHRLRLTRGQRVHYLLGSVQWFGDLVTAAFTILLVATAVATAAHHRLPLRQLTGSVLVVPIVFLLTGVGRALWAMRRTTGCTWGDAFRALRCWFAMSWVVAMACARGLVTSRAEFLRTPKRKDGEASWLVALRTSRLETLLAVAALGGAAVMLLRAPAPTTVALASLLVFQGWLYSNAPWASVAAEGIVLTPTRRVYLSSSQNTGDRPALGPAAAALAGGLGVAAVGAAIAALVATGPSDTSPPFTGGQSDLPRIGSIAPHAQPSSSPPASPSASPSPSSSATAVPSVSAVPTQSSSTSTSSSSSSTGTPTSSSSSASTSPAP
jgi:cellulose synthase/poly-beta-1,6-N-acetylglucosamine synthase-like glycosyltransferase